MPQLHAFITKHTTLQSLRDAWEAVMDLDTLLLAVAHPQRQSTAHPE